MGTAMSQGALAYFVVRAKSPLDVRPCIGGLAGKNGACATLKFTDSTQTGGAALDLDAFLPKEDQMRFSYLAGFAITLYATDLCTRPMGMSLSFVEFLAYSARQVDRLVMEQISQTAPSLARGVF